LSFTELFLQMGAAEDVVTELLDERQQLKEKTVILKAV
jgi:hypothetical protein